MATPRAGDIPMDLKAVKPFLIIHKQLEREHPVVAYFVLLYAVQEGIKVSKSPEGKTYLFKSMDKLDTMKNELLCNPDLKEDMGSDNVIGAQARIENYALDLFDTADQEDRAARFTKNLSKRFFTASQIFMSLKQFGDLSEEIEGKMKYAKWKAVEIDKCLKNGIMPTPGPPGGFKEQHDEPTSLNEPTGNYGNQPGSSSDVPIGFDLPPVPQLQPPQVQAPSPKWPQESPQVQAPPQNWPQEPPQPLPPQVWSQQPPQNWPQQPPQPQPHQIRPQLPPEVKPVPRPRGQPEVASTSVARVVVGAGETTKAQKYCKFASSAIDYDDVEGAIDYLSKALNLLKTGKEN